MKASSNPGTFQRLGRSVLNNSVQKRYLDRGGGDPDLGPHVHESGHFMLFIALATWAFCSIMDNTHLSDLDFLAPEGSERNI